ncbi:MAG: haloacid dehalogenase, partial [Phototrophicaceae bacterium]
MTKPNNFSALNPIILGIRERFSARSDARDQAIARSREVIRLCSESIRATHRSEWDTAQTKLTAVQAAADIMRGMVDDYADLYHAGYTQDALKEVCEAYITYALIRGESLPTPQTLKVEDSTYLLGLAEAATELRRYILDLMRRDDENLPEAERLLGWMDAIYEELVTMDFPDAITNGLRRQTDVVRGVLERTRGDLTTTVQHLRLRRAL